MFCIRSDVITLRSIEMYGLVTVWTSMDDGLYWVILLMYGSHDMRHRFPQVDGSQRDPRVLGCHKKGREKSFLFFFRNIRTRLYL